MFSKESLSFRDTHGRTEWRSDVSIEIYFKIICQGRKWGRGGVHMKRDWLYVDNGWSWVMDAWELTALNTWRVWIMLLLQVKHRGPCRKQGWGRTQKRVDKLSHTLCSCGACQGEGRHEQCEVWARSSVLVRTAGLTLGGVSSLTFHSWNRHLRNLLTWLM